MKMLQHAGPRAGRCRRAQCGVLARVADLVEEQNNKLAAAPSDAIADGTVDPNLDPDVASTALWAAFNGVLALHWRADRLRRNATQVDEVVGALTQMLLTAVLR